MIKGIVTISFPMELTDENANVVVLKGALASFLELDNVLMFHADDGHSLQMKVIEKNPVGSDGTMDARLIVGRRVEDSLSRRYRQ